MSTIANISRAIAAGSEGQAEVRRAAVALRNADLLPRGEKAVPGRRGVSARITPADAARLLLGFAVAGGTAAAATAARQYSNARLAALSVLFADQGGVRMENIADHPGGLDRPLGEVLGDALSSPTVADAFGNRLVLQAVRVSRSRPRVELEFSVHAATGAAPAFGVQPVIHAVFFAEKEDDDETWPPREAIQAHTSIESIVAIPFEVIDAVACALREAFTTTMH